MCLDVCGVNHLDIRRSAAICEFAEEVLPNATLSPPRKAIVDSRVRTIFRRTVAPAATASKNVENAANHAAIVHTFLATHICRQMRFNLFPLLVAQPEEVVSHHSAPNHPSKRINNRFSRQRFY